MSEVPSYVMRCAEALGLEIGSLRSLGGNSGSSWEVDGGILRVRKCMDNEIAALAAADGALPVPRVLHQVQVGAYRAVLVERLPGSSAGELALREPDLASRIGKACAALHDVLDELPAPGLLRSAISRLGAEPDRLLHLDLHPFNILVDDVGRVTGVIDWANAAAGPRALDRARSWAILMLDPASVTRRGVPGWAALTDEWVSAGGLLEVEASARVWACDHMLQDLANRYPPDRLEHIKAARNAATSNG